MQSQRPIGKLIPIHQLPENHPYLEIFWKLYNDPRNNPFMYWATRSRKEFPKIFRDRICKGSKEVFLYVENDKPVGTCRIIQGSGPYKHIVSCASTTIDPEQKRQGTGTRLKLAVQAHIKEHYPATIRENLTYERHNPASQPSASTNKNYYDSAGYLHEGEFEDWWLMKDVSLSYQEMNKANDNPYADWLANNPDLRTDQYFWYTTEVYAAKFAGENLPNYKQAQIIPEKTQRLFSFESNDKTSGYISRLATENDLVALRALYENSYTELDSAFIEAEVFHARLKSAVQAKQLFIVEHNHDIVACVQKSMHPNIDHTILLENSVVKKNDEQAAEILFHSVITETIKKNPIIKRFELNVVAEDHALIKALEKNGFDYCGRERGKYHSKKEDFYFDEFMFDCKLFRLEDALLCCQKRMAAEDKLLKLGKSSFNLPLPQPFMKMLESMLQDLLKKRDEVKLSLQQEMVVYRIVRTLCTQDYLTPLMRYEVINKQQQLFFSLIDQEPSIKKIHDVCCGFLVSKMNLCVPTTPCSSSASNLFSNKSDRVGGQATVSILKKGLGI